MTGHSTKRGPPASAQPGQVRIIGGAWRRSVLPLPRVPGLEGFRPTPDRVRETLFNWLGQDLTGWRCLDAFAGSGALGFECASRGAARVGLVEREAALVAALTAAKTRLKADAVEIVRGDGIAALASARELDLVLLDPPFSTDLLDKCLPLAAAAVRPGAWVYAESARALDAASATGLSIHRRMKAGAVHAHLLQRPA